MLSLSIISMPGLVTGSTDGIGKAYAKELAKRGMNVVLVSRTLEKLEKVAHEIEKESEVKTKIIVADFSRGQPIYEHIERELKDIPVGILVNNVGVNTTYPMYVTEVPPQSLWEMLNVNIGATTLLTRMILPQMQKRQKGAIVNVSSGSELQPLPLMTVYAATKVFIKNFSEAIRFEYQKHGITIQHLSPLFINTKMNSFSYRLQKTSLFVPDAEMYAKNAVNTLGVVDHSTGYWAHGIQYFFTSIPPVWLRTIIGGIMNQAFRRDYFNGEEKLVCDLCPNRKSICTSLQECPSAMLSINQGNFPLLCGFDGRIAIICCEEAYLRKKMSSTRKYVDDSVVFPDRQIESPASRNCQKYRSQVCSKSSRAASNSTTVPPAVIVGGVEAQPKQFPHMALVGFGSNHNNVKWSCGGSLISEYFVLSAAHCANSFDGQARWVRLGELDLESNAEDARPTDFIIVERIVHPEYKPPAVYHDIALFRLKDAVKFNDYFRPICLHDADKLFNRNLIASGWGALGYGEVTNNILMHVTLDVISHNVCSNLYPNDKYLPRGVDAKSQICAGYLQGQKDTCLGDSGGPLQYLTMKEDCQLLYTQVGIVSFGRGCAFKNSPGIYTKISHYIPWIESIVWK
ncbi:hypothetical protein V9T40_008713 [Parthenolecanium corni]|uniref:Peptidase S1 domain-containing protein n=1 Tax=Parthenolecanium corni TaxID=536013 RepID=A0AAN9TP44_9HEMI